MTWKALVREFPWADLRAIAVGPVLLVPLAAASGGYFPGAWGWSSLALTWAAALALLLRPRVRLRPAEVVWLIALAALFLWILASVLWSASPTRTVLESQRAVVYVAGCTAVLLLVRSRSYRSLLTGVWAAIALICLYALATSLFPDRFGPEDVNRLSGPLGYWNALGIFAVLGAILAVGLAARSRATALRALAAASLLVLVPTLYFTFSRGAWLALGAGLAAAVALDPRRLQLITALLGVAPAVAFGVWISSQADAFTSGKLSIGAMSEQGHPLALKLTLLALAAAAAAVVLTQLEARVKVRPAVARVYAGLLTAVVLLALAGVFARYGSPGELARRGYESAIAPNRPSGDNLNAHLFTLSSAKRREHWRIAWHAFERRPWLGRGAGTYEQEWVRHRPDTTKVVDAHSLYLETLAELGGVGLALLLAALAIPLVAAPYARRHGLVSAAFGAYVAYLLHAGIDWDWEMTSVTLTAMFCAAGVLASGRGNGRALTLSTGVRTGLLAGTLAVGAFAFAGVVGNSAIVASEAAEGAGNSVKAKAQARRATRWAPWSSEPWRLLGEAQLAQGERAAARVSFRRAIAKDPREWELRYDLALASRGRGERRALAEATRLNPLSPEIASFRAALSGKG